VRKIAPDAGSLFLVFLFALFIGGVAGFCIGRFG
jgi:hypothetical protein